MTDSAWKHFTIEELSCPCCGRMDMDPDFMERLVGLRLDLQRPLPVTSGFRCGSYNYQVSSTGTTGPHTTGCAVDILSCLDTTYLLIEHGVPWGFTGIGLLQHGLYSGRYVHLDTVHASPGRIWTYNID